TAAGPTLKTEGNLNNEVGVPLTLLRLSEEHRYAAIECGMNHLGEIARLAQWVDPDVGLVTSVGPVHLEGCGSLEGVAHAKGELFHALRDGAAAVASADDARVLAQARLSRRRLVTFGAAFGSDVRLISAHHGGPGLRVEMEFGGARRMAELKLIGTHNGYNAAAASESTDDPGEAVKLVQDRVRPEDVVLVKGSRGMKMERISDALAGAGGA